MADNYEACGARLSQGDVVRAPIGLFSVLSDLKNPSILQKEGLLAFGDLQGTALEVPHLIVTSASTAILRVWYLPAVVISPDCDLDEGAAHILVAPILPLSAYDARSQDAIRADRYVSAFHLPPQPHLELMDGSHFDLPASVVSLRQTTTVTPSVIIEHRMFALGPDLIDRLHERWIRFVALRELSSTGTIDAARGKRILDVAVVESSRKRHTVLLDLEDDVHLVLYQEPRKAEARIQPIRMNRGEFVPASVQATAASQLVLRFENDEARDWSVSCLELGIKPHKILAGATSPLLITCPDKPCEVVMVNDQKPGSQLILCVIAPPRSETS